MSQIVGGTVSYERLVKTGDYENKKLAVTLTFTVDDGDDLGVLEERATKRAIHLVEQGLKNPVIIAPTTQEIAASAQVQAKELSDKKSVRAPKKEKVFNDVIEPGVKVDTSKKTDWPEGQVNGGKDRTVTDALKAAEPPPRIIDTGKKIEPSTMVFPGDSRAAGNAELVSGAVPSSGIDRTVQTITEDVNWDAVGDDTAEIDNVTLVKTVSAATGRGADKAAIRRLFEPLLPKGSLVQLSNLPQEHRKTFLAEVAKL